ncbi:hypothetical protein D3C72_2254300 [compost metagenome]
MPFHILITLDVGPFARQDHNLEHRIRNGEAYRLRALQGVRGRRYSNVYATRNQRRDAIGKRRFDNLSLYTERGCNIVAIFNVIPYGHGFVVTAAHRRKIESNPAT